MSIYKAGKIGLATAKIYHRSSKFGTKHYQSAVKSIKALKAKAKHEVNITKLTGIKTYTKLRAKRIVSSKAFTKTKSAVKEYGPVVAIGGVLGAGIGSIASAGYNVATGYKTKRVKKTRKNYYD